MVKDNIFFNISAICNEYTIDVESVILDILKYL